MAQTLLPSVNFNSNPGLDEFDFLHQTYSDEFRLRTEIGAVYGIVDQTRDPAHSPFAAGRPLAVTVSPVNPLTIDISAGMAITQDYMLVVMDATVPGIPLPSNTAGKVYVIGVEYVLIPNNSTRLSRYGVPVNTRLFRPANTPPDGSASTLIDSVVIAELNDWNNPALYSTDRKLGIVPIAVVTVLSDPATGQLTLGIDLTRVTYGFNRPWYSPVDITHRSQVGSGIVSATNPHGTELQDLSSAGFTLYQQLKSRGGVVAKDAIYYGYPGKFCTEEITLNRFVADYRGTATTPEGMPPLGGLYYFTTVNMPVRPGSLYVTGQPWNPIPYTWIEGTRTVIIGGLENPNYYSSSLTFEYFSVSALEVGPEDPTLGVQNITVGSPTTGTEFIVSSGVALSTLVQTSVSLPSNLGPIKKKYQLLCNGTGALVLAPQPIVTSVKVSEVAANDQTVNQAPSGGAAAPLIIGLTRATERSVIGTTSYDLNVILLITGTDTNGATLQETVTFKASQWKDQGSANVEEPMQFVKTKNAFLSVTKIGLSNTSSNPNNAGPNAIISIWADILASSVNQELAKVACFFWTGSTGIQLKDDRIIATTLQTTSQKSPRFPTAIPENNFSLAPEMFSTLLTPPLVNYPVNRLMLEVDDDRMWSETWKTYSTTDATGTITLTAFSGVTAGTLIRLSDDKVLRLVSEKADASKGDVLIGGSASVLLNNMVATINDPTFDSSWFATLGTSGELPPITLTRRDSYPNGFTTNFQRNVTLSGDLSLGNTVVLRINDIPFTATCVTNTTDALTSLVASINTNSGLVDGITATLRLPYTVVVNGTSSFNDFVVSCSVVGSTNVVGLITNNLAPFTLASPTGGVLPTTHLPQRYLDKHTNWHYLSRPLLWDGIGLVGKIGWTGNTTTYIIDKDMVEVAAGRIMTARRGVSSVQPSIGEFLVDPTSMANTIDNIVSTINNPQWDTGVFASVQSITADHSSVNPNTDIITYPNHGFQTGDAVLFTGIPAFSFSPSDIDIVNNLINHAGHGLVNGQIVSFSSTIALPTELMATLYVVNSTANSFAVSLSHGGSPVDLLTHGSGTHSITAIPNGITTAGLSIINATPDSFQLTSNGTAVTDLATAGIGTFRMSGVEVIVRSNGFANALLTLISESINNTWQITPFAPVGSGDMSSHAIIKTVKPLQAAEWRFKTIEQTGSWIRNQSAGTAYVTVENGHNLVDGMVITVLGMDVNVISVLSSPPSNPVVGDTYLIGPSPTGLWTNNEGKYTIWNGSTWVIFTTSTGSVEVSVISPYQFSFASVGPNAAGTLEYLSPQMGWSDWMPMEVISSTAFRLDGPPARSLYCVQMRFTGNVGDQNGFSVYQFVPEIAGTTLTDLNVRLTSIENEIRAARGSFSAGTLSQRLDVGIEANGILYKDTELTNAHDSTTASSYDSLKARLDVTDALGWWATGGAANMINPQAALYPGQWENSIIRGPIDGNGNSNFISAVGSTLSIGTPNSATPLIFTIQGYPFVYYSNRTISFSSQTTGTYYISATASGTTGRTVVSDVMTSNMLSGTSILTHTSALFGSNILTSGIGQHVLVIPSITVAGAPFYSPIIASTTYSITIAGKLPSQASTGTSFTVCAPHELDFAVSTTKTLPAPSNTIYLGQVAWSTTTGLLSNPVSYRYLGRYTSDLKQATANPNYSALVFTHNLGYLPRNFTLYFYLNSTDTVPNKVLNLGDEAVVRADALTLSVKNRYANQTSKGWDGTVYSDGYIQLVI